MTTTLDQTAVQEVAGLATKAAQVQLLEIDGRKFTNSPGALRLNVDPDLPEPLKFYTLNAFVDYLQAEEEQAFIHVVSAVQVNAVGRLEGHDKSQRRNIASALTPIATGLALNSPISMEDLAIGLQTCFSQDLGDIAKLRAFCASVRSTESVGVDDDGVSQTVAAKRGIAAVQTTAVMNPWNLAPYRTFAEVAQPISPFVLRFRDARHGDDMSAGLYETGNQLWRVIAVQAVATYLRDKLGKAWPVLG